MTIQRLTNSACMTVGLQRARFTSELSACRLLVRTITILVVCSVVSSFPTSIYAQVTIETDESSVQPPQAVARHPVEAIDEGIPGGRKALPRDAKGKFQADRIDPALLGAIQHRSLGLLEAEGPAYYQVLEQARQLDAATQETAGKRNVLRHQTEFRKDPKNARIKFSLFADVFNNPDHYLGELISMSGYVRKVLKHPMDPDDPAGVQTYEAWMYPPDSQHNPVVIVFSELPADMPMGGNLVESIDVTGYFFKIYGYRAQDGIRAAPMLLAKTITWKPQVKRDNANERIIYFAVTGGLVLLFILAFWGISRRNRQRLEKAIQEPEGFDPTQLNQIVERLGDEAADPKRQDSSPQEPIPPA